jgi:beta-1,4-mannosyl-glycoprotein beta-1,4-N-acetylglucosaminyltransferase
MAIYDCFMFWNETELLYMRLDILYNYVDKFIICESKESHSKNVIKEEFVFIQNKQMYQKFMDKIIFIPVDKLPFEGDFTLDKNNKDSWNNWHNENWQRKHLVTGIVDAKEDDIIAISDLDEIYDPLVLSTVHSNIDRYNIIGINHKLFYYYVNNLKEQLWQGSFFLKKKSITSPDIIQTIRNRRTSLPCYINGGWHYSWMGGEDRVSDKFQVIAEHDIIKQYNNKEHIKNVLQNNTDLFNRNGYLGSSKLINIHDNNNAPEKIEEYIKMFPIIFYREKI